VKDPLSFELWIFRNDQSDCAIFVEMIST